MDLLLTPTAPTPPWGLEYKFNDAMRVYANDITTAPVNLAGSCRRTHHLHGTTANFDSFRLPLLLLPGLPAMSVPFGAIPLDSSMLNPVGDQANGSFTVPFGLQLVAAPRQEEKLFPLGRALEVAAISEV